MKMDMYTNMYEEWLQKHIADESNPRRRELLEKGLTHSTAEFLRSCWYPAVGNLDHLYPEWEVRDLHNSMRYLDLAYMPGGAKGCIEIQDFRSHARDIGVTRFKDLCKKHSMLALDNWTLLSIAYLSIVDEPEYCKQLVLAFIGKFVSTPVLSDLVWAEAETVRFARRLQHPFSAPELAVHLRLSDRHTRRILHGLVDRNLLAEISGNQRYRIARTDLPQVTVVHEKGADFERLLLQSNDDQPLLTSLFIKSTNYNVSSSISIKVSFDSKPDQYNLRRSLSRLNSSFRSFRSVSDE